MARKSNTVVACYTLEGKLVKVYPSAKSASKNRHLYPRTIDKCIRGDTLTAKGMQWRRYNKDEVPSQIEPLKISRKKKGSIPVVKLDGSGNIVKTYPSIKQAALDNNLDPHSLRDRLSHKYKFSDKEEYRYLI